ncbi:MAG TPA: histidine kinase dimerization/phospho-acceptor domain-containing protein [Rhizobacter sp.]|nr:histidine kinase dimerization/phospho-acceptor domain-containing protein [Rhizobacter sp.]
MRQKSLMRNLLAWTLGALVLVWVNFIIVGYQTGVHEADELTDGHLASMAHLLLRQHDGLFDSNDRDGDGAPPDALAGLKSHDYQQSMSVIVWDAEGRVLTQTGEAPTPAFTPEEGFADLSLGVPARAWRAFSRWDPADHSRKVMVLLSVQERDDLAEDIAQQVDEPGFWLLPVVSLALGWAIRRGLRPLHSLSRDVSALDVHEATPLRTQPHQEFKAVVDSINTLVERQHAALQRERALSSELAHELRTPLASLALHTGLLRQADDDAAREEALARIEHDAQRASHVVSHLLALARASRTEMAETAQPFDLAALARRVVGEYAQSALASGHELALAGAEHFSLTGHAVLLEIALRNLIENALSHTPRGSLVEVQLDATARWLQVCDNGKQVALSGTAEPSAPGMSLGLGLGLGHQVVDKIAAIHDASFASVPPEAGFSACYRISFAG